MATPHNSLGHLQGSSLDSRTKQKPRQLTKGRVCKDRWCTTILSVYNTKAYCWTHTPKTKPRIRGRAYNK